MGNSILSNTLTKMILEQENPNMNLVKVSDIKYSCPFCHAAAGYIRVFEIEPEDYQDVVARKTGDYSYTKIVKGTNNKEFHCISCFKSWMVNGENEYYITPSIAAKELDKFVGDSKDNSLSIKVPHNKFKQMYMDQNVLLAPDDTQTNAEKMSSVKEECKSKQKSEIEMKEALLEVSRIVKRNNLKEGLKKLHIPVDVNGVTHLVTKTIESKELDCVKKLDEELKLNGRLVRIVSKSSNPSILEQKISKFTKENEKIEYDRFINYLNEQMFTEEAKYLNIMKAK